MKFKTLSEVMDYYKSIIQERVFSYIEPRKMHSISPLEDEENDKFFWNQIQDYPDRGGKYIRSILICMTCEALGGELEKTIPTASAMEISQNWVLIHDDIEDSSNMRRGKEALHLIYGINQSINAGDALHMIQWRALYDNLDLLGDSEKVRNIFEEFYDMLMRTCLGQTAEMTKRDSYDITDDDVNYILDGKTGYYTIAGPMRLGAIIAGKSKTVDKDLFSLLDQFGLNLGRAFQIIDDVLDVTTDFDGLKEKGNDIQEGKRSLLFARLIKALKSEDKARFIEIMDKEMGTRTQDEINIIIGWMESYGVIDEVKQDASIFANNAKEILKNIPFNDQYKNYYVQLIDFLVQRSY